MNVLLDHFLSPKLKENAVIDSEDDSFWTNFPLARLDVDVYDDNDSKRPTMAMLVRRLPRR